MNDLRPLGPEARAAIEAEVRAPGAEAATRRRLRERLWTTLAIAPIVPVLPPAALPPGAAIHATTVGAGHSALTAGGRLLALVARYPGPVVAASLTVGGFGGVALHAELGRSAAQHHVSAAHVTRVPTAPPVQSPQLPAAPQPPPPAPPIVNVPLTPPAVTVPPTTIGPADAASHGTAHVPSRRAATPMVTPPASVPSDVDLTNEAALVERARTALARGWIDSALSSLEQHRVRFPAGQLLEERDALRVLALARAGRLVEATRLAAAFEKRFPSSLWYDQVEAAVTPEP
jgi:hypothetical protein